MKQYHEHDGGERIGDESSIQNAGEPDSHDEPDAQAEVEGCMHNGQLEVEAHPVDADSDGPAYLRENGDEIGEGEKPHGEHGQPVPLPYPYPHDHGGPDEHERQSTHGREAKVFSGPEIELDDTAVVASGVEF